MARLLWIAPVLLGLYVAADLAIYEPAVEVEPLAGASPSPALVATPRTQDVIEVLSVRDNEKPGSPGAAIGPDGESAPSEELPPVQMFLRGTLLGSGQRIGLLEVDGQVRPVRLGDQVGGARILEVREMALDYDFGGVRRTLEMGGPPGSAPAAVSPPPVMPPATPPIPPSAIRLQLYPGHPLVRSGLQNGDMVLTMNGALITSQGELENALRAGPVTVEIDRAGMRMVQNLTPPAESPDPTLQNPPRPPSAPNVPVPQNPPSSAPQPSSSAPQPPSSAPQPPSSAPIPAPEDSEDSFHG
ncbi:MAG: hypothetical protein HY319_29260 [Armatimonadetes bacterium]|nr:hypothetical protein [Armatimonadota bacterium]